MPGKGPRSNSTVFRVRPGIGMLVSVAVSPAHVKECVDEARAVKSGPCVQRDENNGGRFAAGKARGSKQDRQYLCP
jgi:hypothetical protein